MHLDANLPGTRGQKIKMGWGKCFTFSTIVEWHSILSSIFWIGNAFIWFKDLSCLFCIISYPEIFMHIKININRISGPLFIQKVTYYVHRWHFTSLTLYILERFVQYIESILILFLFLHPHRIPFYGYIINYLIGLLFRNIELFQSFAVKSRLQWRTLL